jgi:hypothetical protein
MSRSIMPGVQEAGPGYLVKDQPTKSLKEFSVLCRVKFVSEEVR